jgi:excinuclease ABC subunit C
VKPDGNKLDMKEKKSPKWEEKAKDLPPRPGVYIFKDKNEKVLYIGKAKSLRARVRSYTRDAGDGRPHIIFLRKRIHDLDFIVTDNEKEALILENNLIKKHRPRYNIRLRDDKTYFSIRLTLSEKYPRLILARRPKKGGEDAIFGPFSSSGAVKETMRMLQEIFPLRRCSKKFRYRDRACLNFQIGKCVGPCTKNVTEEEYKEIALQVLKFLKGQKPQLIVALKKEMLLASESEEFEKAAAARDRILAIEKTLEKQKVDSAKPMDRDIIGYYREGDRVVVHRLGYRGGVLLLSVSHSFARVNLPDDEVLSSFISQLFPERGRPPEELLLLTVRMSWQSH